MLFCVSWATVTEQCLCFCGSWRNLNSTDEGDEREFSVEEKGTPLLSWIVSVRRPHMVTAQDTGTSRGSYLRPEARKPKPVISLVVLRDLLHWDERVDLDVSVILLGLEGRMLRCEKNIIFRISIISINLRISSQNDMHT